MNHALLTLVADGGIQVEWGPWHGLAFLGLLAAAVAGAVWLGKRLGGNVDRDFNEPPPPNQ